MHAVGDMADGNFLFHPPRPEMGPHPAGDVTVQGADGIGPPRELQPQHGHAEGFALVVGLDAAQPHELLERDAQLIAQRPEMLFDQAAVEAVVPGGDRRVRGEHGVLGHFAQAFVERHAVFLHPLADRFQRGEHAVPLVEMIDAGRNAQRLERPDAADPQHHLLANAHAVVAAVKPAGEFAIFRAIASTSQSSR